MFLTLLDRRASSDSLPMDDDGSPRIILTAAQRVLGIGELLENVLSHASEADVLRCRRVNRKFWDTITYSKTLRRKLFLEPGHDDSSRTLNPLVPTYFHRKRNGYRDSTVAARIDLADLWLQSHQPPGHGGDPLLRSMYIARPPIKTCVIPVGTHTTIFFRRNYPEGMTFGDLEKAVISAFEIRKGRKSSRERLDELSVDNSVLMYWS